MSATQYLTVEPEAGVCPIGVLRWTPDLVDYERHSAYGDLIRKASAGTRLEAASIFAVSMIKLLCMRLIKYEFIPFDVRTDSSPTGRMRFVRAALKNIVSGHTRPRNPSTTRADAGRMMHDGIHVVTMPDDRFTLLNEAAEAEFDRLAAQRRVSYGQRQFEESRGQTSRAKQRELFDTIEATFTEAGVFAVAAAYLGRQATLIDVNPQINDVNDSFWRDIFPDLGLKTLPPTAYCHRDASGGDLKAIIYMTDVNERTGPFSYVVGSNRIRIRCVDDLICEANDSNGLAGTDSKSRAKFAALPKRLRQKGAFGNDLTPDSALGREIKAGLWTIKAPRGSIVLFDTKGIHRGAMVEQGERRVITCVIG